MKYCPKCDEAMEHEPADPSVGIMSGSWYCPACDEVVDEDEDDSDGH